MITDLTGTTWKLREDKLFPNFPNVTGVLPNLQIKTSSLIQDTNEENQ